MKRIFPLLVVMTMLYSLCIPVFAVEETPSETPAETVTETVVTETVSDGQDVTINVVMPAAETSIEDETAGDPAALAEPELEDSEPEVASYAIYSLDEPEAPVESSLPAVLVSLFGEYQPRTQTVTEYLSDGSSVEYTQVVPGLAGLDWLWISSVLLFGMFLYCVLRMIGGCLRWS